MQLDSLADLAYSIQFEGNGPDYLSKVNKVAQLINLYMHILLTGKQILNNESLIFKNFENLGNVETPKQTSEHDFQNCILSIVSTKKGVTDTCPKFEEAVRLIRILQKCMYRITATRVLKK